MTEKDIDIIYAQIYSLQDAITKLENLMNRPGEKPHIVEFLTEQKRSMKHHLAMCHLVLRRYDQSTQEARVASNLR